MDIDRPIPHWSRAEYYEEEILLHFLDCQQCRMGDHRLQGRPARTGRAVQCVFLSGGVGVG